MENFSESVELHDKYQFEVKFTYPVDSVSEKLEYNVETFFFIPNNLCVNSSSYSREDFFHDMQKHIRFKTPSVLLRTMDQGDASPLAQLSKAMKELVEARSATRAANYKFRVKMFCSILKSALRDEAAFLERSKGDPNFEELSWNYLRDINELLAKFRQLKIIVQAPTVEPRLLKLFELADEFASMAVEKRLVRFALFLKSEPRWEELRGEALGIVDAETSRRAAVNPNSVIRPDSDNEQFLYRESVLKKVMASILFLRTSAQREGVLLEQMLFGFAAGVAMAFATFVAFYSRTVASIQDLSVGFFLVLVVSYMFKDRIKELFRNYLSGKLRTFLCDYRTDIFSSLDRKVGICRESFNFIPESKLPKGMAKLRNKDYVAELDNGCLGEDIIHARKGVRLFPKACARILEGFSVDGVVDIMRFNIRRFLEKMDNPGQDLLYVSGGELVEAKGRRVYHVNLIIKYGMPGHEDRFKLFRLILSRNGIRRIEELRAAG